MSGGGFTRGGCAIVGAATFGQGECPGYSALEMAAQAGLLALRDAGIGLAEVDALHVCLPQDFLGGLALAEHLGISPAITDNNRTGGSSFLCHVIHAALALEAGLCDVALVTYGSNQRTASGKLVSALKASVYEAPHGATMPVAGYALAAARHMHQYGTTRADLGAVAVAARGWAKLNPEAFRRDPLSAEEHLAARLVASPLGVLDCCLVTDGAAAVVLVRADRARDCAQPPAYLLGGAAEVTHKEIAAMPDLTVTGAARSGARAYTQARLGPGDVDVVQLYDAFTMNTILFLEDLGFCPKGEGGRFVEAGHIAPGGGLPVNTNGGGLSCCHPGMYGLMAIVEAARQIRGDAANQIPGANTALAHGNGGTLSAQATIILGSSATF